jgi:predicted PurR-regulated permease PerM
MNKLRHFINLLFTKKFISKFVAYFLLIILFYFFRDFLLIFLLTFILAYLFLITAEFFKEKFDLFVIKYCNRPKVQKVLTKVIGVNFFIIIEYILLI